MTEPFLISDDRLRMLSATRQGRVSIAGYNYQAAYAVARLASMAIRQPVFDLEDWPLRIRYDWGEDLDELHSDGTVRFTQCKRVTTIGQPAALAEVVAGFAPKWLWVPESERNRLRFRLVCSDPRFAPVGTSLDSLKADVSEHFLTRLKKTTSSQSDRAAWIADADAVGYDVLFEALWSHLDCVYLPADVVDSEPAGPRLAGEKEALRVLLERGQIDHSQQDKVLGRLRRLIHDNLILFDPTNEFPTPTPERSPRRLDRADVNAAIDVWRPAIHRQPPFQLVDRTFLSEQRELERQQFVARQPDWSDVAHGHDETIKFIERDQTEALETAVLEKVVGRLGRGGRLPTLFVAGAPGDGKTTIARRVAARLVDAGELLIADTGVGLQEPPGEPDEYVQAIERLQGFGRPVVLLLDDPLYAESPWLTVLKKLNRPGLQIGVLAATPQFLLDEHKSQLQACELSTFDMERTSQNERKSLAALYGRSVSSKSEEDFLVVAMEAAAGVPFQEIIDRLWRTLADARDLSTARRLSDLPWQIRAYLFVCFFSRTYVGCPETLLLKLLEMTGGVGETSDVNTELQRMKHFGGWRIFRIGRRPKTSERLKTIWNYAETLIAAAHVVIARQAWKQRPLSWVDVIDLITEASIAAPQAISDVTNLALRLRLSSRSDSSHLEKTDRDFARRLLDRWYSASDTETLHICEFLRGLQLFGGHKLAQPFRQELIRRCEPGPQGWLAAQRLRLLGHRFTANEFLVGVNTLALIKSANFAIASARATHFGRMIMPYEPLWNAFMVRLVEAFEGKLGWNLDAVLVSYLMRSMTSNPLYARIKEILDYGDDPRLRIARLVEKWLDDHVDDNHVRTQYLALLRRLPREYLSLQVNAAKRTSEWLNANPEDTYVRTQFLSFLLRLPDEYSDMRGNAEKQTREWLSTHREDTYVRAQFLAFLLRLPQEYSDIRVNVARQTAEWLRIHPNDTYVRKQFLIFLASISEGRARSPMPVTEWQKLVVDSLSDVAFLIKSGRYQRGYEELIPSSEILNIGLDKSLKLNECAEVRKVLEASREVVGEWHARNLAAGFERDLPRPSH